jgi:hypothetical protein
MLFMGPTSILLMRKHEADQLTRVDQLGLRAGGRRLLPSIWVRNAVPSILDEQNALFWTIRTAEKRDQAFWRYT